MNYKDLLSISEQELRNSGCSGMLDEFNRSVHGRHSVDTDQLICGIYVIVGPVRAIFLTSWLIVWLFLNKHAAKVL